MSFAPCPWLALAQRSGLLLPLLEVQLSSLGALTSLALNDDNKNEIRELQAIPKIINLLDMDQNKEEVIVEKAVEVPRLSKD